MSYKSIFSKVPVKVPNRAGHNLSHENLFSTKVGTLTPAMVEEVYPNEIHNLNLSAQIQLPPFATDAYGRIDAVFETFFVSNRLLYGGWQEFITYQTENSTNTITGLPLEQPKYLPIISLAHTSSYRVSNGTLSDYLGNKFSQFTEDNIVLNNILPYLAYHKIWSDWYRVSQVQRDCFSRQPRTIDNFDSCQNLPYISYSGDSPHIVLSTMADDHSLLDLRQRPWAKDYFTNCTPLPQSGEPFSLQIQSDSTGIGSFNMNQLYALNSLQQFSIRHNIAGNRYADNIFAFWGCYPSDAIVDRSLYLGRKIIPVYTKSVYQTNTSSNNTEINNPFNSVGSKYGSPMGVGSGSLVKNFKTTEHGFLITIFSLVPRPYYSSGQRRYLRRSKQSDYPNPILHGIGDQPVYLSELSGNASYVQSDSTFGYTQYASECKFHENEVHGLLADGQSLDSFAIQRSFDDTPLQLGTQFLEIPTNFLDQISAFDTDISDYGCWVDAHFDYKKLSPFQPYSIPTLMDMENTHTVMVDKGGKRL